MNSDKSITSVDGHKLDIYIAEAKKDSKLGLVILQEIFGVNSHIRDVCDSFANIGLTSIAPALFDRSEPGLELNYETADIEKGRSLKTEIGWCEPWVFKFNKDGSIQDFKILNIDSISNSNVPEMPKLIK